MRHGYKGAFEMAATLDYLFAFSATTGQVAEHHFTALTKPISRVTRYGLPSHGEPGCLCRHAGAFRRGDRSRSMDTAAQQRAV